MSFYEAKHQMFGVSINKIKYITMKKISLLSILLVGMFGFMTSCSSSDDCHECHIAYMNAVGDEVEVEIGEFCGDALADVETDGYSHTIEETIVGTDTVPAGTYSDIHCEEHGDHDHDE